MVSFHECRLTSSPLISSQSVRQYARSLASTGRYVVCTYLVVVLFGAFIYRHAEKTISLCLFIALMLGFQSAVNDDGQGRNRLSSIHAGLLTTGCLIGSLGLPLDWQDPWLVSVLRFPSITLYSWLEWSGMAIVDSIPCSDYANDLSIDAFHGAIAWIADCVIILPTAIVQHLKMTIDTVSLFVIAQ